MTNIHISEYLDYYLKSNFNPGFAVLLKGQWGCGKTWFIKQYQEKYNESEITGNRFLYVTLYGVNSYNEIEDQLFQQLHPFLSSKKAALAGKILKGVLRAGLKIDLDGDDRSDATISPQIPDIHFPDYLKNTENSILVFDDLERSCIPIKEVLGYINFFVEHQNLKVIIIGNEEELNKLESDEKGKDSDYFFVKEKLIGKSFHVNHDINSAFDNFIKQIENTKVKSFLNIRRNQIIRVFNLAAYNNLRHLKQALWDFERFYVKIEEIFLKNKELMTDLLMLFFAFSFELKKGFIQADDIKRIPTSAYKSVFDNTKTSAKEPTNIETLVSKYEFIVPRSLLLSAGCWFDFFDKGFLAKEKITEQLENSKYFDSKKSPTWVLLWHYFELNDQQFKDNIKLLREQWKNREFRKPGEILHVSGLFLSFSKKGLIKKSESSVIKDCKGYIRSIENSGDWKDYKQDKFDFMDRQQWGSLMYYEYDTVKFKEIYDFLQQSIQKTMIKNYPAKAKDLLNVLSKDADKFARTIAFMGTQEDNNFYNIPILKYVSPYKFLKIWMQKEKFDDKRIIAYAIKERYQMPNVKSVLIDELDFLRKLESLLNIETKKRKGKVSGLITKDYLTDYINNAIDMLN